MDRGELIFPDIGGLKFVLLFRSKTGLDLIELAWLHLRRCVKIDCWGDEWFDEFDDDDDEEEDDDWAATAAAAAAKTAEW